MAIQPAKALGRTPRCSSQAESLPERGFDRFVQAFQSEGHVLHGAVDEKRGRGPHAALRAAVDVLVHPLQVNVLLHLVVVAIQVQLGLQRVLPQARGLQVQLVLEEEIVHLPELALRARRLGGLGRELGVRMHFHERELPEHEAHPVPEVLEQHFHGGISLAARRALEIPVFDDGHFRRRRPQEVIGVIDRDGKRKWLGSLHRV